MSLVFKKNVLKRKQNIIIMYPLPRLHEIDIEVDKDNRAVYFEQVKNGIYMRIAILDSILLSDRVD